MIKPKFKFSLETEPWMGQGVSIHPDAQKLIGNAPLAPNISEQTRTYEILEVGAFSLISPTFQGVFRKAALERNPVGFWDIGPLWHFLNSGQETAREILLTMKNSGGMLLLGTEPQEDKKGFLTTPRLFLHGKDLMVYPWCCGRNSKDDRASSEGKVSASDLFVFVTH